MLKTKKAQLELTFHWVYILIAGALILLFFFGIVTKQKASAEQELQSDVVRIMGSILSGAGVSEQTKQTISTSGLADYTFEFKCDEEGAGFGIKGGKNSAKTPLDPIFAPKEIKTNQMILWSLPYKMPFKVMDFLIVTSVNTKYFVVGESDFKKELKKAVESKPGDKFKFNFDFESSPLENSLDTLKPEGNFQVRIIDLGNKIQANNPIPINLKSLDDDKVTAVSFLGTQVTYFQKNKDLWKRLGPPIKILSLGGEYDAAKYAAIFVSDGETYQCNMMKAFQRLEYLNEVYAGRLKEIKEYYNLVDTPNRDNCQQILSIRPDNVGSGSNMELAFAQFNGAVSSCMMLGSYSDCYALPELANKVKTINGYLSESCISLY